LLSLNFLIIQIMLLNLKRKKTHHSCHYVHHRHCSYKVEKFMATHFLIPCFQTILWKFEKQGSRKTWLDSPVLKHFYLILERPGLTRKMFFSTGLTSLGHNLQDSGLTICLFTRELAVIEWENLGKLTANLTKKSSKVFENSTSFTIWFKCLPGVVEYTSSG